jgi:hypothetical protein
VVSTVDTIELLIILSYFIAYMYLGLNLLLMAAERKITISPRDFRKTVGDISLMLSKEGNPKEYRKARFYFWGAVIMIIVGMGLLGKVGA